MLEKNKHKFSRNHSLMVFYKNNWEILFQDRTSISKDWEKYGFFGGWVDQWESFLDACIRETKEELNLNLDSNELLEAVRFTKTISSIGHCENVVYIAPWKNEYMDQLQILEWDAWVWMSLDEAKNEIFFNHDYMVFNLLERYFEHHDLLV